MSYFNPRTRVECDGGGGIDTLRFNFNPRTRVECDRCLLLFVLNFGLFQSTHSCRVRRDVTTCRINGVKFQSTHSCRVRRIKDAYDEIKDRFQSTHSCRVRRTHSLKTILMSIFQSTHSCRVRLKVYQSVGSVCSDFNPRTRVECDSQGYGIIPKSVIFQSTHSCRVRRLCELRSIV